MNKQRIDWQHIEELYKADPVKHAKEFCNKHNISYSAFTKKVKTNSLKKEEKECSLLDKYADILNKPFDRAEYQKQKHKELVFIRLKAYDIIEGVKDINVFKKALEIYTAAIDRLDKHIELSNKIIQVVFDDSLRKRRDTPADTPPKQCDNKP